MKKICFISVMIVMTLVFFPENSNLRAQSYSISNVARNAFRTSGTIMSGKIVKGYFFLTRTDKLTKNDYNYNITVLDENLKEIAQENFIENKYTVLVESSYNGNYILFKFIDNKNNKLFYRTMDKNGKLSEKVERDINKREGIGYTESNNGEVENTNLNSFGNSRFLDIYSFKDDHVTYKVDCINNNGENTWSYTNKTEKGITTGSYLGGNQTYAIVLETYVKNALSNDFSYGITSIDSNGNLMFNLKLRDTKYNLMPFNVFVNEEKNQIILMGQYFNAKEKSNKSSSKGLFLKVLDKDGGEVEEFYYAWDGDIDKMLPKDKQKEIDQYSIYFHSIVMTKDHRVYAIGEQYRKQVSAGGTAIKAVGALGGISTNTSMLEIKIGNMVVISFNNDYSIDTVEILEKKPNKVILSQDYAYANQHLLAKTLYAYGEFDFSFTQSNEDNSVVSLAYVSSERNKGSLKRTFLLNFVNFVSGENGHSNDKITINSTATSSIVWPAKPGYVMLLEYFKKEKKMDMRLEPINF